MRGAKDRHPLPELQIGCDYDTGLFIKLANEVEQQRPTGFRERDVPQLINDHAVHLGELADDFTGIPLGLFFNQGIDELLGHPEDALPASGSTALWKRAFLP